MNTPTITELQTLAKAAHASGLMPQEVRSADAALYIMASGIELGLQPMISLRTLRLVKGRISIAAEAMLALAISHDIVADWQQADNDAAILILTRKGGKSYTSAFTMADARKAGLGGDNWTKYPAAMLRARAISAGVRAYCPDVVTGLYSAEEVADFDDAPRAVQIEARPSSPAIENRHEPMQIEAKPAERSIDELRAAAVDALSTRGILPLFLQHTPRAASEWSRGDITNVGAAVRRFDSRTPSEQAFDKRLSVTLARIHAAGIPVEEVEQTRGPFGQWSHDDMTKITDSLPASDAPSDAGEVSA